MTTLPLHRRTGRVAAALALALAAPAARAQVLAPPGARPLPTYATLGREGLVLHAGGTPRRLADPGQVDTFCFDRDGRALVVTRGRELARVTLEGTRVPLLEAPGEVRFPDVSPRDGAIAFALRSGAADEQRWSVALVDERGGGLRVVAPGYDPCFTPDGGFLVYEDHGEDGADLWMVDVDDLAATPRRLAPPREEGRFTPCVAPDGARVVFSSKGRLCALGLFDGVEAPLTPKGDYDRFASFAPDGARVLFYRQREGRDLLVLREADGTENHSLGGGVRLAQFAPAPPVAGSLAARLRAAGEGALDLDGVLTLGPADARLLGSWRAGATISLPALRALDARAAAELARYRGTLRLTGLPRLEAEVAAALASAGKLGAVVVAPAAEVPQEARRALAAREVALRVGE